MGASFPIVFFSFRNVPMAAQSSCSESIFEKERTHENNKKRQRRLLQRNAEVPHGKEAG
jgi:hypothetical protein